MTPCGTRRECLTTAYGIDKGARTSRNCQRRLPAHLSSRGDHDRFPQQQPYRAGGVLHGCWYFSRWWFATLPHVVMYVNSQCCRCDVTRARGKWTASRVAHAPCPIHEIHGPSKAWCTPDVAEASSEQHQSPCRVVKMNRRPAWGRGKEWMPLKKTSFRKDFQRYTQTCNWDKSR